MSLNTETAINTIDDSALIEGLLSDLTEDEILQDAMTGTPVDPESQLQETLEEIAEQPAADLASTEAKPERKKREKKAKAPKEPKEPRPTSVTHKPGDLLLAKLGDKAADYLTFAMSDLDLTEEARAAKRAAFIERMNGEEIADKVREKVIILLTGFMKGGTMNEVIKRAFTVLHADGKLTSGDKGNLQQNLLTKPYSLGTARSQANQIFMLFPELGITIKEKGQMLPNPDSTILMKAYAELGLLV